MNIVINSTADEFLPVPRNRMIVIVKPDRALNYAYMQLKHWKVMLKI